MQEAECRVPAGIVAIGGGGGHALATVINHLYGSHQCCPLTESLWLVTNEPDQEEYAREGGFFDNMGKFSRNWQAQRAISNGCSTSAAWGGHVADLQCALRQIAVRNTLDTIVIDANSFFWPTFGMQARSEALKGQGAKGFGGRRY